MEGDRFPASLYDLAHGAQKPCEDADYRAVVFNREQAVKLVDTAERFLRTVERMLDR